MHVLITTPADAQSLASLSEPTWRAILETWRIGRSSWRHRGRDVYVWTSWLPTDGCFETLAAWDMDRLEWEEERYASREAAQAGHARWVRRFTEQMEREGE